jgi:hypothetical protein
MNYGNLFIFIVTHVRQLGNKGRGVVVVRNTPLEEIIKLFDEFLSSDPIKSMDMFKYSKETDPNHPEMVIYRVTNSKEHIVFGKSEQGWKGDYGVTHTDIVVSIH